MLNVTGIGKSFGKKEALKRVSFHLNKGETVLLLGKNGAGKTTLMQILLDHYKPDTGKVEWELHHRNHHVGAVFQEASVMDRVTVKELISYTQSLHINPHSLEDILHGSNLHDLQSVRTEKLSIGQKRQLLFALSLVGRPELLILDEPTAGMDVLARKTFYERIRELKKQGITIIMTTHLLEEATKLGERVLLLDEGVLLEDRSVASITQQCKRVSFTLSYSSEELQRKLEGKGVVFVHNKEFTYETAQVEAFMEWMVHERIPFTNLTIEQQTVDQYFEQMVQEGGEAHAGLV
ncbi:ABC transporter ATP-binding protein [Pontibacillus halophilus]|nr:ABC transporter ATP-binding protein [Pontibacillus halophilus]